MASLADAEEALGSTDAKANFQRLTRLLVCGGVTLLRETFDSIHSPTDLPLKLGDPAIQVQLKRARVTRLEWDCLYPSPGLYGTSTDFDITLVFRLLRTICGLTPPPRGWDDLPNITDHSLEADLARIKYYRNEVYGHNKTMEIRNNEFVRLWEEISKALLRIAANISLAKRDEWKKSIDDLRHNPLTPREKRHLEELETWYKQDIDVKQYLEKLDDKVNTLQEELRSAILAMQLNVVNNSESFSRIGLSEAACSEGVCTVPICCDQAQTTTGALTERSSEDHQPNASPDIPIWNVVLSFKESFNLFFQYLRCKLNVFVRDYDVGSLLLIVECSSLQILEGLWEEYCSGHLNSMAQEMLITPQVLEKLGLTEVKLKTFISEEEYKKGKQIFKDNSADNDDDGFDLIKPSVIQQLRAILDQYPDDGQILKELIQNAEDAHASHVKFLHDKRSHGTAKLHSEGLAQFQVDNFTVVGGLKGPALYAYNDAQFTKEDWRGIRMLFDSIKVKDPMKVGRFGLGFKSVFHVTDLPSIVSGSQIGVFDPHEEYFGDGKGRRTGHRWRMKEDRAVIDSIPDQFRPYKGIFDCSDEVFADGFYNGTLFRFPLRTTPSELSQTLYSAEKVHTLFESFMADAHLILLFLQYLESIELYVRDESDIDIRKTFEVRISDDNLQLVREKRQEFRSDITRGQLMPKPAKVTYPITIEAVTYSVERQSVTQCHSFLVTNYFCAGEISSEFRNLASDRDLSYLPLVGVAMALPESSDNKTPDIKGHVFCFLPLPVQKTSLTGFPVHVNGFFALSQNRRYIKTPNAEQEDLAEREGRPLTDKSLLWNQCLLQEAIPKAYASLLMDAIKETKYNVKAEAVYRAWPDISSINQKWKRVQKPLFQLLCNGEVIYTPAQGGQWLSVKGVIFERLADSDPKKLLVDVFLAANQNVAYLPRHALEAISLYSTLSAEITPSLTRTVLKNAPSCYRSLTRVEKLLLLKFVLKDSSFSELIGLELLPISNEQFTSFSNSGEAVYICSPAHPRELLPCLQQRFLDKNVDEDLLRNLEAVATQGFTQLRHLSKDDVDTLISTSLPHDWSLGENILWYPGAGNHPSKDWLPRVWGYLGENFSSVDKLRRLEGLPLLPLDMSQVPVTLARLKQPSNIVVRSHHGECLDDTLMEVLKALGVIVMKEYPVFLRLHPAVAETFVHPPSTQGVLKAVVASLSVKSTDIQTIRDDGKRSFRKFVAKASSLGPDEKQVLHCFPLFETLSEAFVSKKDGLCAAPDEWFPVKPCRDLIDIREYDSKRLAGLLNIRILTPPELLLEELFPDVEGGRYSFEEIDRLMEFVMDRYHVYNGAHGRFKEKLKALPFVSTKNRRVSPMEVFDPRNDSLRRIFAEEHVFPVGKYNQPAALVILGDLGMKGEGDITSADLYESAKAVNNISNVSTAKMKSEAIMAFLTSNPSKLHETTYGTSLGLLLRGIPWVSVMRRKPDDFPQSLMFWGETHTEPQDYFRKPSEVKCEQAASLIGSVMPLVKAESSSQLASFFSWNEDPAVLDVVQHLQNVISCYSQDEKPRYILVVERIYAFLSRADYNHVIAAFQNIKISAWIWNGDGFSSPKRMLSQKPPINLSPYICSLPSEVAQFYVLFASFGLLEKCDDAFLLEVLHLIKEKYDNSSRFPTSDVRKDLQLSVDILNEIKPNVGETLPPALQEKVVIPTHVEEDAYLKLAPVEKCMYCEHEWLERITKDEEMDYFYVHPNIPTSTAELLLVPTLMNRMLEPDELELGEEFGQEEKLTRRLNKLLDDYTDGFAVLKELVQNADDAGATEVKFLYDERTNEDAMTCLIDEEMRHCQGPALWVYNDAEFRDEDFTNITKLNHGTKEMDTEKIGKFGLGFNAVYNLTDVPMFLSRNYFVIFDPNTFYLGKAITNKNKPGIKININKNSKRLRNLSNQFKPFNGIFSCDLHLDKDDNSYHGTLFRFPLRTKEQAIKSEIKQLHYDSEQMKKLLNLFARGAKTVLLFTQNVRRVSVFHLPKDSNLSHPPTLLFEVSKSLYREGMTRELSVPVTLPPAAKNLNSEEQYFLQQCNFLRASSEIAKHLRDGTSSSSVLLSSALTINIKSIVTECGRSFVQVKGYLENESEVWLVASSMGKGKAMQFTKYVKSLLPSAGVAAQLIPDKRGDLLPVPVLDHITTDVQQPKGRLFCYLPLPVNSGFPVHVNGAFAVASSRRGLKEKTTDDKDSIGVEWNNLLMQDSICEAYLDLLEDAKKSAADTYQFHVLWPKACEVEPNCEPLARSFYQRLASGGYSLFSDGSQWVDINHLVFLEPKFRHDPKFGELSFAVFQLLKEENEVIIDLPAEVYQSFVEYELTAAIQGKCYDKSRFFSELFFPNIASIPSHLRDDLVMYALDDKNGDFDHLIKTNACIPTSPDGRTLKCPAQLINPIKLAALLFSPHDERFPFGTGNTFLNGLRLAKLEQLGMLEDNLPWPEVAERAESISILSGYSSESALTRVKALIDHLERKLIHENGTSVPVDVHTKFLQARFLPVLQKPEKFPLSWKGDELHSVFLTPTESFLEREKYLVCCSEPIVDVYIPVSVQKFLHLDRQQATVGHVIMQLDVASSVNTDCLDSLELEHVKGVCSSAYRYFQRSLNNKNIKEEEVNEIFQGRKFIFTGKQFFRTEQMAFRLQADCSPYLHQLPHDLARSFDSLMKSAGVKAFFEAEDFITCLKQIKQTFGDAKLDSKSLQVAVNLAVQLGNILMDFIVDVSKIEVHQEIFYLPDSKGVMRPYGDLCMRDCPWMPDEIDVHYVNDMIPYPVSTQLGVKTRREEALKHLSYGISFGQREKLTNRLQRILTAYPCEKEILKELLQNADDAQATEICFIKDPRQHPDERVFEDSWKPLQGPALCVYNNKPFTEADIVGIQNLGEGSKGDDPNKTGQYGVGFNAVYHLTDVPSFASSGEEIGDVLCIFDPHCKYVPGATIWEPGRMFRELPKLRDVFPDVFSCYNEEEFPLRNSTMFRFPLRTEEMANNSKISNSPVTVTALDDMMKALKRELFEVLLFVNSVRKITLCEIDPKTGKSVNSHFVEAEMTEDDAAKRQEFATYVRQIGKSAEQRDNMFPNNIEAKKCSYVLNLRDSVGNEEKWLIVQQVGFENNVQSSITEACKRRDLGMLPRGGVACLLEKKSTQSEPENRKTKAYCFLPLPLETNLPVHINGHFALDHEARRSIWRDEGSGYRSDWNNALLADVIASCYLTLLDEVRNFHHLPITRDDEQVTLQCNKDTLLKNIDQYERLFPLTVSDDTYWATLGRSVYQGMDKKKLRLLPVVRSGASDSTSSKVQLTWLPPTGESRNQAFFNNLDKSDCFISNAGPFYDSGEIEKKEKLRNDQRTLVEEILLQTGFNLVKFSLSVYEALTKSGVDSRCVSPSSVMEFYKTFKNDDPHCGIGPMHVDVGETPFKSVHGVILVLKYCKNDKNFLANLSGLPLLVTQDSRLHEFSIRDPKFLSRYHDVLPQCREMFVHDRIRIQIFGDAASANIPLFKRFGVQEFATNLNRTLPPEYYSSEGYVTWCPTQESEPNQPWVYKVWKFLNEEAKDVLTAPNLCEEEKISNIRAMLEPLLNWSILPCTETIPIERSSNTSTFGVKAQHFLAPLRLSKSVLDFTDHDATSRSLVEALRILSLAEANCVLILDSSNLMRKLVATLKTPESLLISLGQKIKTKPKSLEGKLKSVECRTILEYFSGNVERLQEYDKNVLRRLPFYQATHGGFVSVNNSAVCVLPSDIPRREMDEFGRRLNVVFLEMWPSLSPLFKFLGFQSVSSTDIYCNYILQYFGIFSKEQRLAHLKHIRDGVLPNKSVSGSDKTRLLACLKDTAIITAKDETLKKASSFYDPNNDVFSIMLAENLFPPEPFNEQGWLSFLKEIGLICEVSQDIFKMFAKEVAREGAAHRSKRTDEKSKVLVKHLFLRQNVVWEGLLPAVCDIRFVATTPVRQELRALHPQFGETNGQTPYVSFKGSVLEDYTEIVWTTAALLPHWANPWYYHYQMAASGWNSVREYCNAILAHLQVFTEPTVNLVTFNCQNVCLKLEKEYNSDVLPDERCTRMSVVRGIYTFLQAKALSNTVAEEQLKHTPCILVEQGGRFVYSKQVVIELYRKLEIHPFLYGMPAELSAFKTLFQYLGCSPSVKPSHYVMVLDMLHRQCKENRLDPNEVGNALRAVKGLLETLQDTPDTTEGISTLYLPATCPFNKTLDENVPPVVLAKSTELIFDDAPHYHNRIREFNLPFVVDLRKARVCTNSSANFKELIMLLPTTVRPQMMSCVIEEKFADTENETERFEFGIAGSLKKQLLSEQFYRGIVRLIRHANQDGGLDQSVVATVRSNLQRIEFHGMGQITTHLVYNGQVIPGSQVEVPYFMEKISEFGQEKWKVYINAAEDVEEAMSAIALTLSQVIAEACRGLLRDAILFIPDLLRVQPGKICSFLDRLMVQPDDFYDSEKGDVFPPPGSFIPVAQHNLLNPAFKAFIPGEYVGYELDDPSLHLQEGEATYIYAVIIEEVLNDSPNLLTKCYKINIGHDQKPKIVQATEIYKFHRLQEIASSAIALSDHQESSLFLTDKQQIFDEISKTLEEAWRLPEDVRRQIIKRLILQWHPDKNPGNEMFCKEVFQYIKHEIERLERGESHRRESWSSDSWTYQGSYGAYFRYWGARARQYNSERQEYRNRFFEHYKSYSHGAWSWEVPPNFCATNPQPAEARRWLKQAEADLTAADNDIATLKPSFEWACFKCHQAAEKALKAAQYSVDSNKTSVHNLVQNSLMLHDSQLTTLSSQLETHLGDSTCMRYPDQVSFPRIPNDIYSQEMAREALQLATRILDNVRSRVK